MQSIAYFTRLEMFHMAACLLQSPLAGGGEQINKKHGGSSAYNKLSFNKGNNS